MNRNKVPDWLVKGIWLVVSLLLFYAYFPLNSLREPVHSLETAIDDHIPVVPEFVFPYLSLYLLLFISLWRFLQAESRLFVVTALAISLDLVISYFCAVRLGTFATERLSGRFPFRRNRSR